MNRNQSQNNEDKGNRKNGKISGNSNKESSSTAGSLAAFAAGIGVASAVVGLGIPRGLTVVAIAALGVWGYRRLLMNNDVTEGEEHEVLDGEIIDTSGSDNVAVHGNNNEEIHETGEVEDQDPIIVDAENGDGSNNEQPPNGDGRGTRRTFRDAAIAGTAAGVGVPLAGTAALTAAGFTGTGIAAGSFAAGLQGYIGTVAAGSTFATLQSIGATGGLAILGPVGLGAAAVGAAAAVGYRSWRGNGNDGTEDHQPQANREAATHIPDEGENDLNVGETREEEDEHRENNA